jgi:diguanylate cyclase (GGDEF)-like protein
VFQLPLPEISEDTTALIVRIEGAHSVPLLTESKLTPVNEAADWSDLEVAFLALVVGMLVLPLFLNITFFVALRERYVLLHAAVALAMIGYVVFAGGFISLLVQLPVGLIAVAGPLCWAMGSGFLALFLAEFLEEGVQSAPMRKLTLATGWFSLSVTGFFALQLDATQGFDGWGYYFSCIPVTALITLAIGRAAWKGSVSARYIAAGWLPIVLSGIERMMRGLGIYVGPSNLDQLLYLAWGIQVIMLSLAIAHRFVMIRSERDAALREARVLERLSERDPLTGLLNRRVVEERIAKLRKEGFDTFALIDLDRFKLINDQYGHQTGDEVLVACGKALIQSDEHDCVAARLGGEEFVVLLRGKDAYSRAEALRRSIPELIANEVEGVEWPVTASMGLIELPRSSHELLSFQDLYSRADQLLYNAKASGRDRTCFERLKVFNEAPQKRQVNKVAA